MESEISILMDITGVTSARASKILEMTAVNFCSVI